MSMIGDSKYAAFKEDKFTFDQLSKTYQDDVYGEMRGEASLKDLVNE